jgi:hypothetical protein
MTTRLSHLHCTLVANAPALNGFCVYIRSPALHDGDGGKPADQQLSFWIELATVKHSTLGPFLVCAAAGLEFIPSEIFQRSSRQADAMARIARSSVA